MGFSITPLAQKARTQTLIIDSDLDMGEYDVIATDVKGDTAEFTEFVGGVGNFTNGLISGGLDVGGIMHAESTLQVDGNVVLEGSINNVNISDDGEITTSKGVNGADFNGVPIKSSGIITVTPTQTFVRLPYHSAPTSDPDYIYNAVLQVLPLLPGGVTYTGSVILRNEHNTNTLPVFYSNGVYFYEVSIQPKQDYTLSFTDISYLICSTSANTDILISKFTLS